MVWGWLFIGYTVALVPVSMLWYRVGAAVERDRLCDACEAMVSTWHTHANWCGVRFGVDCDCAIGSAAAAKLRGYKTNYVRGIN
jgi:hypothetical protein